MDGVVTLILAAGASSRMGRPKGLLPWGRCSVLEHVIRQVKDTGGIDIIVVTGAHHTDIAPVAQNAGAMVCQNPDWERGMGASLQAGLNCIEQQFPNVEGVLVLLVDQPLVTSGILRRMIRAHSEFPDRMVVSSYGALGGVPALFPRVYLKELTKLPPGIGARKFINEHLAGCIIQDIGQATTDMDTEQAYWHALEIAGIKKM